MEDVSASPSEGQLLKSSGKQCLQAGHSFICWLGPEAAGHRTCRCAKGQRAALDLARESFCAGMYADTSHSSIRRLSSQQLGRARLARSMKSAKIIATRPRAGKKSNSE